jgi:hypothetical protein
MQDQFIRIDITKYKQMANTNDTFEGSTAFDRECGIDYYYDRPSQVEAKGFRFKVIDTQKYFIAKIKYGI